MKKAVLLIEPTGDVICLYTEVVPLQSIGRLTTRRATTVEFNEALQEWQMKEPGCATIYHSNPSREACLEWERRTFGRPQNLRELKQQGKQR